ncbi:MAG TPA: NAD-dependent epimerase/dehydratase family protein [Gemmatimonadaceae bacterium]|jgi:nucleoside-diphosphate-sugar epimerase|nr:NAD-dependent epimerase/dehydratase family protein [Gemmatimonadaceae bacterium]
MTESNERGSDDSPSDDGESAALIGYTGFVGGNLLRQRPFTDRFNSSNIDQISGRNFDLVVVAGARAEKWKANADPERDLDNIECLIKALSSVDARKVVLISTVDVFKDPVGVDEESAARMDGLHAYGRHRRRLEQLIGARFDAHIVRLPGLYGPGLRKNVIFDFLNDNEVAKIDSRGVFQFYDLDRLWADVEVAMDNELPLVHLATEPVSVAELARSAFELDFTNEVVERPARYDVQTRYAHLFGGEGRYIEDKPRELAGIAGFVERQRSARQ